jgi:hypothetical protein
MSVLSGSDESSLPELQTAIFSLCPLRTFLGAHVYVGEGGWREREGGRREKERERERERDREREREREIISLSLLFRTSILLD